jgi:predicted SnoaL-like aldol condensation-catalyzing enzyme
MSSSEAIEQNKRLVAQLFDIINGVSLDAIDGIDGLVAEDYIQHQPRAEQGREGLRRFLRMIVPEPKELDPKNTLEVTLIGEGDLVVRKEMRTEGMLIDIFRIKDGMLQEHWDAFRFNPGVKRIPGF